MGKTMRATAAVLVAVLAFWASAATAQIVDRVSDDEVKRVLERFERSADAFRSSLDRALDASPADGSRREDRINRLVRNFEEATDSLRGRFDDDNQATGLVEEVLRRAARIDRFMANNPLTPEAQSDWAAVRLSLDELARAYHVTWDWTGQARVDRVGDRDVRGLLSRIEAQADTFRRSLDRSLDASEYDGTSAEDEINGFIHEFERATDRWESTFDDDNAAARDATEVLRRAARIDAFMATHRLSPEAHTHWANLRVTLDELARAYNVTWSW